MSKNESVYALHGYENRREYLLSLAQDYGVPFTRVLGLANALGEEEDFDALITYLDMVSDE